MFAEASSCSGCPHRLSGTPHVAQVLERAASRETSEILESFLRIPALTRRSNPDAQSLRQ